jgi:hypothetical protein
MTERNKTTARDPSNLQKRKETATGVAFWIRKMATIAMIISKRINTNITILPVQK